MGWYDETLKHRRMVTPALLLAAMPNCPDPGEWARALDNALHRFHITDVDEVAQMLAHVGHESSDLTRLEESMHYSAKRLMQVWPARFPTLARAQQYAANPEALANNVYAGRMGNGSAASGDGHRFIGRGPIQLTGRSNYTHCADSIDIDIVSEPQLLATNPVVGALSAAWYWSEYVGRGTIKQTTKRINGGYHGLADREQRYSRTLAVIA